MQLDYAVDMSGWTNALVASERRGRNLTPAHDAIGDLLIGEIGANFETQGGASPWATLRPSTLRARAQKYPGAGDRIMFVTGELLRSMTKVVEEAYVDVGSALKKARFLNEGTFNMVARGFFQWRDGVMERVGDIYVRHLFGDLLN